MTNEMTEERLARAERRRQEADATRLAYHRQIRDFHKPLLDQKGRLDQDGAIRGFHSQIEMHADAVDRLDAALVDNDRLRAELAAVTAERERMKEALERIAEDFASCLGGLDCYSAGPAVEHASDCPMRIAHDALSPEPQP